MKRLFFLLLAMCSFTLSYSQSVEGLLTEEEKEVTEKTLDDAYLAVPKKLVNKRWYTDPETYFIYNSNGTGARVIEIIVEKGLSSPLKVIMKYPFRWKRNGAGFSMNCIPNQITITPVEQDLAKLSARVRAELKSAYAGMQKEERQKKYIDEKYEFFKLTNDVFICGSPKAGWGYNYGYHVTKKKLDELINRKNKIEEQKKMEEEAKKKTEDLSANSSKVNNTTSSSSSTVDVTKVYDVVEQMPSFPEGQAALFSFLSNNINYPEDAKKNGVQGRVTCSFIVERDGTITDVRVIHGIDPLLDKEAIRVLKLMPCWNPGKQNGETVRVKYTTPVTFKL